MGFFKAPPKNKIMGKPPKNKPMGKPPNTSMMGNPKTFGKTLGTPPKHKKPKITISGGK